MRFKSPIVLSLLCCSPLAVRAQNTVGEVFASDAAIRGSVVFASGGTQVLSGSQVAAGVTPATLKLQRGGNVRICPGTNLSVATSPSGNELMLSLSSGSMETNYPVNAVADTVLTPDFRMQMIGPGVFHLAIAADNKGNTCIKPLKSNTASVIVTELMGNATYQVKPGETVLFPLGKIAGAQNSSMEGCGCPEPEPVERAEAKPEEKPPAPPPQPSPKDEHVQLEAPFVYQADLNKVPDIAQGAATLKARGTNEIPVKLEPTVMSPQAAEAAAKAQRQAEEARAREAARQQELAAQELEKQKKVLAKQEAAARKAQQKRDKAAAKALAQAKLQQAKMEQEAAKRQQEEARREADRQKAEQAAAVRQARLERKQKEEMERQRGVSALDKSNGGVFHKIGSFFGRIFK